MLLFHKSLFRHTHNHDRESHGMCAIFAISMRSVSRSSDIMYEARVSYYNIAEKRECVPGGFFVPMLLPLGHSPIQPCYCEPFFFLAEHYVI